MKFHYHNKLIISNGKCSHAFFNTMLGSVFEKLKQLQAFNKYVSIGEGLPSNSQSEYHLTSPISTVKLSTEYMQSSISKGSCYVKKIAYIDGCLNDGEYITEVGLSNDDENPIIYNYISLISDDTPNGIKKEENEPIVLTLFIYLDLEEQTANILTDGKNKFIEFLLGEGINKKVYAFRGNNTVENKRYEREKPVGQKYEPTFTVSENENSSSISLSFEADLQTGETSEIVFAIGDSVFSRKNVLEYNNPTSISMTLLPKRNYVLDLGKNIKSVESITNNSTSEAETATISAKYASDFADKTTLPFNHMFSASTPRFLSKDGNKIFFVNNDSIYGFVNKDYQILKIDADHISLQNIFKIVSFDSFVFVITKTAPYVNCYVIENYKLKAIPFDLTAYENYSKLSNIFDADITMAKDGTIMLGVILKPENYGHCIYFSFDTTENKFVFSSAKNSQYYFTYIIAMFKNNFCDAAIHFLKEGEMSLDCRIVTFSPNTNVRDVFTNAAYFYTKDTKQVYAKNRAIIVEKTTTPSLWVFYYPQVYRYNLSILGTELDDYISTNLIYLIQKKATNSYKIYNLVGYDTPTEFSNGFPSEIDQSKILDFEFLGDTLLIFMDNKNEPIVAYNLKENSMLVENVSSNEQEYTVSCSKYNLLGANNEGVVATFSATISLWFLTAIYQEFQAENIRRFLQNLLAKWNYSHSTKQLQNSF